MEIKFYTDEPPTILKVTGYPRGEGDVDEYDYEVLTEDLLDAGEKAAEEKAKDKFREMVATGKYGEVIISRDSLLFTSNMLEDQKEEKAK